MKLSREMGNPMPLRQNADKSFQGSIVLGKGFVLTTEQAEALIAKDSRNEEVLFPYLNGDDLNNDPEQSASRWIINFFDWPEDKACSYPDCFEIVERLVRPERQRWKLDKNGNEIEGTYALRKPLPQKWWIYAEKRPALYKTISKLDHVMGLTRVSKYVVVAMLPAKQVYMEKVVIKTFNEPMYFSILQSSIYNEWAWKYSSTLGAGTINYSPSACFDTYPFPQEYDKKILNEIGKAFYSFRENLMKTVQLGLTKAYNQFHNSLLKQVDPDEYSDISFEKKYGKDSVLLKKHLQDINVYNQTVLGIEELRSLQVKMDFAVLQSYGWTDIELQHGFYELEYLPENDRVRFTIHPIVRKEILKRLLKLNSQLYKVEITKNCELKSNLKKNAKNSTDANTNTLF